MPEGDTVFQTAHRLRATLVGKTLTHTDFRVPRCATADLSGWRVTHVRSVGKHLFIDVADDDDTMSIHSHLLMEGVWHVHRVGSRWRRPAHRARVVLRTDDAEAVGFELGTLELLTDPASAIADLGPDLLGPGWDPEAAAFNLARRPTRAIGDALLDQTNLAGVGNVYRSEVCFIRRINPLTPVRDVDLSPLVAECRRLLDANKLRPVRSTTGSTVRGRELWVYGRDRRPCRRCGSTVVRSESGGRSVFFCPACQPVPQTVERP